MKTRLALISLVLVASVLYAVGQGPQGMPHRYDVKTETTMTGSVDDVTHPKGPNGMIGTHFTLKTETGVFDVHAGPETFLAKQGFTIAKGDTVTVTGSKLVLSGTDAIIAKELKKGDKVLTLRDANGIPKWSRGAAANN